MARFSVVVSIAVLALVALYTNQVLGDVVAVIGDDAPKCYKLDSSDCKGKIPGCTTPCCDHLKYGVADDQSTYAIGYGNCTCCAKGHCKYGYAEGTAINPHTQTDAAAFSQRCDLLAS